MNSYIESIKAYIPDTKILAKYGFVILKIILIWIGIKIVLHFGNVIIDKFFQSQKQSRFGLNERKADTLSELLKSILKYALYTMGVLNMLDVMGFPIGTLLVGAGLGGVAIGFGAQSLIKDIISGFFIIFEDQFSVGDYVTIDDMSGIVEAVGLRITKIKGFNGDLHIIPNGQITKVTNHSRDNARALIDIDIAYEVNIDRALIILNNVTEEIKKENNDIIEGPSVLGVQKLGEYGVTIRLIARTKPMKHWGVEMDLRKKIKDIFDKEGIKIPYPTRVIITKSGNNL